MKNDKLVSTLQTSLTVLLVLLLALLSNFFLVSHLVAGVAQNNLRLTFAAQTANATAPTSELTYNKKQVATGAPVALIEIPSIGVSQVVVEGTDSATLRTGIGHRRDTVLPGQEGMTVLMGKRWSYGAPFGALPSLKAGAEIITYTGQGKSTYVVERVRRAGDVGLAPTLSGESQLVLTTVEGEYFVPTQVVRVDAKLTSKVFQSGTRITQWGNIPAEERELGIDLRFLWQLAFAIQFLIIVEIGFLWALRRFGIAKTWLVFGPLLVLALVITTDQITRVLPNLM